MATLFQRPLMGCALGLSGGAAAYSLLARQQYRGSPLRMDSSPNNPTGNSNNNPLSSTFSTYTRDAQTPVVTSRGGLNAKAVRQMTLGSILGLASGLTISLFSKPLALLLGLAFLGLHTAEKQLNMRIIPYDGIQKYFKGIDLRGAVQDNAAMKVSFGVMFALSGFASFWRVRQGSAAVAMGVWGRLRAARAKRHNRVVKKGGDDGVGKGEGK